MLFDIMDQPDLKLNEKNSVSECLGELSTNPGVEIVICEQITKISKLMENAETEDMAVDLLKLVAQIKSPDRLSEPESFIRHLLQLFEGHKARIAAGAAECLVVFARECPGILDRYAELIQRTTARASGELLRQCLELQKVMNAASGWSNL
jgi:hypothetical protein